MENVLHSPARYRFESRFPSLYYWLRTAWLYLRRERAIGTTAGLVFDDKKTYEPLFHRSAAEFEKTVRPYIGEFSRWLPGRAYNGRFNSIDAEYFYSKIREVRPRRMIEVGSGHSTAFALEAIRRNGWKTFDTFTSIDPSPRRALPRPVKHLASKVEDADVRLFDQLESGDILSIDSSHMADEVTYQLEKILPRLKAGVVIHYHDIFYPYKAINPEETLLLDYYGRQPDIFQVLTGMSYVRYYHKDLVRKLVPSSRWSENVPHCIPSSLWALKVK